MIHYMRIAWNLRQDKEEILGTWCGITPNLWRPDDIAVTNWHAFWERMMRNEHCEACAVAMRLAQAHLP